MTARLRKTPLLILLAAGLALAPAATAAQPQLSLSADKNKVGLDDTVELQLSISGDGASSAGEPVIEGVEHFDLLGTSHGDQLSIVNMNITRSTTYRYSLRPKKAGESVTLRAKVAVGGTNYLSGTVTIETTKGGGGAGQQPPGMFNLPPGVFNFPSPFGMPANNKDDYILQARIAPTTVYVGQESIYTLAFYQGADVYSNINFGPPALKNFWTEQPEDGQRHDTKPARLGGRNYTLTEMRILLYPMEAGDAAIPPATISFQPNPFTAPMTINSNQLKLKVKPLPEKGKPAGFSGLVGNFTIASAVRQKSSAVGQPFTLAVTVSGRGALHAIPKPEEPAIDAERYDPEIKDAFHRTAHGNEGSRTFNYIYVPKKQGTLSIPPFSLTFFDPASATYETVKTGPLTLPVAPAPSASAAPAAPAPAQPAVPFPAAAGTPFYRQQLFYALMAAFLVAALGITLRYRRRPGTAGNTAAEKALKAGPVALERLSRAEEFLRRNDSAALLGAVEHAIRLYLSDKLDMPPAAITPEDITHRLPAETQARYRECISVLQACFDARYSPGISGNPGALLERAKKAVTTRA